MPFPLAAFNFITLSGIPKPSPEGEEEDGVFARVGVSGGCKTLLLACRIKLETGNKPHL